MRSVNAWRMDLVMDLWPMALAISDREAAARTTMIAATLAVYSGCDPGRTRAACVVTLTPSLTSTLTPHARFDWWGDWWCAAPQVVIGIHHAVALHVVILRGDLRGRAKESGGVAFRFLPRE